MQRSIPVNRDIPGGVAGLDSLGNLLVPHSNVVLTPDGPDMRIVDRDSGNTMLQIKKLGTNDFRFDLKVSSAYSEMMHTSNHASSGSYAGDAANSRAIAHGLGRIPTLVQIWASTNGDSWNLVDNTFRYLDEASSSDEAAETNATSTYFYVGKSGLATATANNGSVSYVWVAF